jgi:hypothetical protein
MDSSDMVIPVPLEPEREAALIANKRLSLLVHSGDMRSEMRFHLKRGIARCALKWADFFVKHRLVPAEV